MQWLPTAADEKTGLQACLSLGIRFLNCIVHEDEREARLWEISENLHRAELTVLQRAEHIEEWRIEDDPLWRAYVDTPDAIVDSEPLTIFGLVAKARAAKAEAMCGVVEGGHERVHGAAAAWA